MLKKDLLEELNNIRPQMWEKLGELLKVKGYQPPATNGKSIVLEFLVAFIELRIEKQWGFMDCF